MQKTYLTLGVVVLILLAQCAPEVKVEYVLPHYMTEQQKSELKVKLDRGLALYKPNCSGCHGIFKKGKDGIPNFTARQIDSYKARHELHDSSNHAFAMKMPPEDLDAVLYFLLARKMPDSTAK
jgi:mono/diheme cytochrome c family protein